MDIAECKSLEEVRANIDRIDAAIIKLVAERGAYVAQAARFKKSEAGVRDSGRVEAVIQKARGMAEQCGANPDIVEKLYREMIAGFIELEMKDFKNRG